MTGSLFKVTAPEVTVKSVESNEATPFTDEVASFAVIVIVLFVTAVSIAASPVTVNVSVRRLTVSVPVSPAIDSVVAKATVEAAVNLP